MSEGLYRFEVDFGRMGIVSGAFIEKKKEVSLLVGKNVFLGDALGKHSDVSITIENEHLTLITDDIDLLEFLKKENGSKNIAGYNPLDYLE